MKNMATQKISLQAKIKIGQITTENIVPQMLATKCADVLKQVRNI